MAKNKQPQGPAGPDFLDAIEVPAKPQEETTAKLPAKARYICTRPTAHGTRSYSVGEVLELELEEAAQLSSWPAGFMPTQIEGAHGVFQVPIFFCLRPCNRMGREYKPGEIWERFTEPAPEGLFKPWAERSEYEFISVSGVQRAELHRKAAAAPVGPGPNRPAA